jgi:hypothetical protein
MREKLIELLGNVYLPMTCGPDTIGEYRIPHKFKRGIADHLIANGVVVSKMETTTDKDRNVPSKVVPHKVDADHVHVGSGIWRRGTTVYKCPKCQTFVMRYCKYCFECGQALEWQTEPPKGE